LAEAVMGPLGVVGLEPGLGDLAQLLEGVEEIGVEDFFSELRLNRSMKAF
jgi:hypothetical protein